MKKILEELWYGNIIPGERGMSAEEKRLARYLADHHESLCEVLGKRGVQGDAAGFLAQFCHIDPPFALAADYDRQIYTLIADGQCCEFARRGNFFMHCIIILVFGTNKKLHFEPVI